MQPGGRDVDDVSAFLKSNEEWILNELDRVSRLRAVRRPGQRQNREILYRGEPTEVRAVSTSAQTRGNAVRFVNGDIVIFHGTNSATPLAKSLENWLRKQARLEIEQSLRQVTERLRREPRNVYVMGQRTKWGNCSSKGNLSFNWRLILAPNFVLRYLVTHEAVHLVIPDHSAKFWLTVQSMCAESERAKQWLSTHHFDLMVDLETVV